MDNSIIKKYQDDICKKCANTYFNGSVNTDPWNLCEGRRCLEASEDFMETDEYRYELRKNKIKMLLKL